MILILVDSCATTSMYDGVIKKTRPAKYRVNKSRSCEDSLKEALLYIWRLENYVDLIEAGV